MPRRQGLIQSLLTAPVRSAYFTGKILTSEDMTRDQEYHRDARRRLLLAALGPGVVTGLRVRPVKGGFEVSAGMAVDAAGREIIVPGVVRVTTTMRRGAVLIRYAEMPEEPVPEGDDMRHNVIREGYEVRVARMKSAPDDPGGWLFLAPMPRRGDRVRRKKA